MSVKLKELFRIDFLINKLNIIQYASYVTVLLTTLRLAQTPFGTFTQSFIGECLTVNKDIMYLNFFFIYHEDREVVYHQLRT